MDAVMIGITIILLTIENFRIDETIIIAVIVIGITIAIIIKIIIIEVVIIISVSIFSESDVHLEGPDCDQPVTQSTVSLTLRQELQIGKYTEVKY